MSLLLDALKKAEQEKLKAREAETADAEDSASGSVQDDPEDELSIEQLSDADHNNEAEIEEADNGLELVLDEDASEQEEVAQPELDVPEPQLAPMELEKSSATTSTVSDEALQLLVYKTNKKYRHRQKIIWGSLVSTAIIILMLAGTYYYLGMVEEVDALERKHKLAMRAVTAEPVKRRSSVVVAAVPKAEEVEQSMQPPELKQKTDSRPAANTVKSVARVKKDFSVKQTKIKDPISALLLDAWQAYNRADYAAANTIYQRVLNREPRNRDALLGMAAIAIKNADYEKAKSSYRLLLKLNPRDQVAVAAMTNLNELSSGSTEESRLKFLLQQQPSASHLNFALGNYYARKGKWPEAQSEYFKAWQANNENADYAYNLAVSLDQLGKAKQALRFYKESLALTSNQNISFSKSDVEQRIKTISAR
ncbi:MAG: tetratricopeptide repeat protein [Gammaproteobacteria bacterium]|nr:tetratricopeptide repeat protein [Gammaproteobacteria bacterium]MCW8922028.1 tetratricopeptide repeat protein [Gammaproteobacteria bacterium]